MWFDFANYIFMKKTFLVTGAAGFIGARVCARLLSDGHAVVGVDNLNDYYSPRLKSHRLSGLAAHEGFRFHEMDIESLPRLEEVFAANDFAAVVNLAARAGVRYSMENPHVYMSTNAQGTLNLLECMRKHGVKKFVLASTSSLYAGQPTPFVETLPVNTPISPYAASKKAAEVMAYTYHHLFGIDVSVVRYFTVYGPAGRPDMSPYRFIKWIAEESPITIYGDGKQSRDFTYVDDIAAGTVEALRDVGYEIINLGGGREPVTLLDMISMLERKLGRRARLDFRPFHSADMMETSADISKASRVLGWSPKVGMDEGLDRTVEWYQSNSRMVLELPI